MGLKGRGKRLLKFSVFEFAKVEGSISCQWTLIREQYRGMYTLFEIAGLIVCQLYVKLDMQSGGYVAYPLMLRI